LKLSGLKFLINFLKNGYVKKKFSGLFCVIVFIQDLKWIWLLKKILSTILVFKSEEIISALRKPEHVQFKMIIYFVKVFLITANLRRCHRNPNQSFPNQQAFLCFYVFQITCSLQKLGLWQWETFQNVEWVFNQQCIHEHCKLLNKFKILVSFKIPLWWLCKHCQYLTSKQTTTKNLFSKTFNLLISNNADKKIETSVIIINVFHKIEHCYITWVWFFHTKTKIFDNFISVLTSAVTLPTHYITQVKDSVCNWEWVKLMLPWSSNSQLPQKLSFIVNKWIMFSTLKTII
jgi:hypothetical protein